ncbi:MAG: hypothetical protein H6Q00_1386 [Holophagaceae bacterium]|nr:hypothetical protein [Holophagaceae bacterium]
MNQEQIEALKKLRAPFEPHQISKLPKPTKAQTDEIKADYKKGIRCDLCGTWHHPKVVHLDYVGHAALTDRLLDVDPCWNWEPMVFDEVGFPRLDAFGGMWIKLTICGMTRIGYGDAEGKTGPSATKERIGDALRNAAMRFGAALDLWHKGDLHPESDEPKGAAPEARTQEQESNTNGWDLDAQDEFVLSLDRAYQAFKQAGQLDKYDDFAKKWTANKANDPAEKVLTALAAFVVKLEAAALKKTA